MAVKLVKADVSSGLMPEETVRFASLFAGYSRAHGQTRIEAKALAAQTGQKVKGNSWTKYEDLTLDAYHSHLSGGGVGLGVIMLRDDCTVSFGVIDHDDRTMDHVAYEAKIRELGLPLVLCRSKSGGGHFYLFVEEPADPVILRDRLVEYLALLRLPVSTEVFPKQTMRVDDSDVGSWINLPYYAGLTSRQEDILRPAMDGGAWCSLQEFLGLAETRRISLAELERTVLVPPTDTNYPDGPPCLQWYETQGGFPIGGKKNGMFSVGVYLQKTNPDDWESKMETHNSAMAQLNSSELVQLTKSLGKKQYQYKCNDQPLQSVCQKGVCKKRKFGVGGDLPGSHTASSYEITDVTKYEVEGGEPLWVIELNGTRIQFTHAEFYDVNRFNSKALAAANIIPAKVNQARWKEYAEELAQRASKVPSPSDASSTGQMWAMVQAFLDEAVRSADREGLRTGKVLIDNNRIHFRSPDLYKYLRDQRIPMATEHELWGHLRNQGATHGRWHVRGSMVSWWSLPYDPATEERATTAPIAEIKEAF